MAEKITKGEKVLGFVSLWIARGSLTVLAVAGMLHLLGGKVDPVILYPVTVIAVGFLLKETI